MQQLAPADPNVKVPRAVARAAQQAKEAQEALVQSQQTAGAAPSPVPAKEQLQPPAPPPAPEPKIGDTPLAPAAATPPAEPPAPPPAPSPAPNWENDYKAMKGRFERSEQVNRAMRERMAELEGQLASLQMQGSQHLASSKDTPSERLITDKEVEDYGPDLLQVMGKKAKEELNPLVKELKDQIADLKAQLRGVQGHVVQNSRESMVENLDAKVPQWRELNEDQDFINWLGLRDKYSGGIRHSLLKEAWDRNETARVLAFFQGYLAEAAQPPAPTVDQPGLPAPPIGTAPPSQVSLESLAAPGRAKAAASSSPPAEKPIITTRQISQFYADSAAGRYRGREDEYKQIERLIWEAQREGRIR